MAYLKTIWVNNTPPAIDDINLNKIEVGIDEAHVAIENTSTGHDHDGADSKKVDSANVINTPAGNVVATDIQEAITELDGQDTTIQGNLDTHISDTSTHGVSEVADAALVLAEVVEDTTPQLGGNLDMNGHSIGGNTEVQIDDAVSTKHTQGTDTTLGAQAEDLDMNTHKVIGVVDPTTDQEAATKKYVDDNSINNVAEDTTPQLGGDLDLQNYKIVGEGGSVGIYVDSAGRFGMAGPSKALVLIGSLELEPTTSNDTGVIYKGADRFIHDFAASGSSDQNTFVGLDSGNFTMAIDGFAAHTSYNTAIGAYSMGALTTGFSNSAVGASALISNTTGSSNSGFGNNALQSNTTGASNLAIGQNALRYTQTGDYNTGIGRGAGQGVSGNSFYRNTLIGYRAGFILRANANNNILLGYQAGNSITTGINNIIIGYDEDTPTATTSNHLNIGGLIYGDLSNNYVGINTTAAGNPLAVNRSADGIIVDFESADTVEGNISIAGNTTSYNAFVGSHYTQLKVGQKELPIGAVVISTGEIIPCEAETETTEEQVIIEKDAFETVEIPAVVAVQEKIVTKHYIEDGIVKTREKIIPAVEAQPARTEKRLKEDCHLNEDTGAFHKDVKTIVPKGVSGKEYFTYVDTTTTIADKRVYGVWNSKLSNDARGMSFGQDADPVYLISQVGLFKIRVTDTNGNITNGDYLESSSRPMEAQKQISAQKLNSTITKALIDVDWAKMPIDAALGYRWALIPCIF